MPLDPLKVITAISAKDEASKQQIVNAFALIFDNPIDAGTGLPRDTPEQLVKRHVRIYIKNIVSQAARSLKESELISASQVSDDIID